MGITSIAGCGDDTGTGGGDTTSSTTSNGSTTTTSASTSASTVVSSSSTGVGMVEPKIQFAGNVGAVPFDCAETYMLGTPPTEIELTDYRLYVHDVRLVDGAGEETPLALTPSAFVHADGVALLDFEDKTGACGNGTVERNTELVGAMVPDVGYTGIRFKVGVPAMLNHADAAVADSPLNLTAMFWSWAEGYKFARIDARGVGMMPTPFFLHIGATGCMGDPTMMEAVTCTNPNIAEVSLDGFDFKTQKVVVDYAAVVADIDFANPGGGAPGCMSGVDDVDCEPIFAGFGLVLDTGLPTDGQTLFRVE
jgi:uncharacterized repeat protein (TIGR04052 family)